MRSAAWMVRPRRSSCLPAAWRSCSERQARWLPYQRRQQPQRLPNCLLWRLRLRRLPRRQPNRVHWRLQAPVWGQARHLYRRPRTAPIAMTRCPWGSCSDRCPAHARSKRRPTAKHPAINGTWRISHGLHAAQCGFTARRARPSIAANRPVRRREASPGAVFRRRSQF